MNIQFTPKSWRQLNYWVQNDRSKVEKINALLRSIKQNPFKGLGSPEPLRHELKSYWSRRIDSEHRLVYKVKGQNVEERYVLVVQCRYHY